MSNSGAVTWIVPLRAFAKDAGRLGGTSSSSDLTISQDPLIFATTLLLPVFSQKFLHCLTHKR